MSRRKSTRSAPDTLLGCDCDCKHCRADNHCQHKTCFDTQRFGFHLMNNGRLIADITYQRDFTFFGHGKRLRLVPMEKS